MRETNGFTDAKQLFDDVLSRAIIEVRGAKIDLFTFAVYHDHESGAVSVCADDQLTSARSVASQNVFSLKHFKRTIAEGDLKMAALFKALDGHNVSLGDFAMVNVARTDIGSVSIDDDFYLTMIRAVRAREHEIAMLASDTTRLLFCASSVEWEVGFTWIAST